MTEYVILTSDEIHKLASGGEVTRTRHANKNDKICIVSLQTFSTMQNIIEKEKSDD